MRPNQLNPAQLMMGFLSSEHGKLSQKIVASEFSRELDAQSSQLATVSCFGPVLPEGRFAKDANPSHGSVAQTTLNQTFDIDKPLNGQKAKALQRLSPRSKSVQASQEKVREDLVFTDVAMVESIAAQLRLPAEARKALKSSEDNQGRISFKALAAILNQQIPSDREVLPGQDQATAQDVQQLLNSIRQAHPDPAQRLPHFKAKPAGTYSIEEFKNTLEGMVQQITRERMRAKQTLAGSRPAAHSSSSDSHDLPASPTSVSPGQVQRISSNLMPSFSDMSFLNEDEGKQRSVFAAPPAKENSYRPQTPQETTREVLVPTDTKVLDRILAQLPDPDQARQAMKTAEDTRGRVSYRALAAILNEQTAPGRDTLTGQVRIAVRDVQELFGSIPQSEPDAANQLPQIETGNDEFCTLEEFKTALDKIAHQIVRQKTNPEKADTVPVQTVRGHENSAPDAISLVIKQEDSALEPVQTIGKELDSAPESIRTISRKLDHAPEPIQFHSKQQNPVGETVLIVSKKLESAPEPEQFRSMQQDSVTDSSLISGKQLNSAPEPVQSFTKQGGSFSEPHADKQPHSAPEPVQFIGMRKSPISERPAVVQEPQESVAPSPAHQSRLVASSVMSEKISMEHVENTYLSDETVGLKGNTLQGDGKPIVTEGPIPIEGTAQPAGSIHSGSERVAQLGSFDSSLVSGAEEEAHSAQLRKEGSSLEELSGASPDESGSRQETSKAAPLQSSSDPSSQDGREAKQGREFATFQAEEKAPQATQSKTDSFGEISSSMQINQAGQQGSRASSSPALSLSNPNWPVELSERFHELKAQRRNELTLELEPQNMGKLTLRIETDNNHVTAWISTDNDHVKSLLTQNSPVLRQHLQEQGLMLGQFLVDVRQEKGNQHYPQQNRTARRNPRNVSAIAGTVADDTKAGPGRRAYRQGSDEQLISFFA